MTGRPEEPGAPVPEAVEARQPGVEVLGQVAAALAHEVRNPLNAMSIHLQLLETRLGRVGLADEALAGISRSLQALHDGVARIDAALAQYVAAVGPRERSAARVEVGALLTDAAGRAAARWGRPAPGVEAPGEAWPIEAAAVALAVDLLLDNAAEATRGGGLVRLRAHRPERGVGMIEVIDEGEGLAPEVLDQAFRLGFSTRRQPGLGLCAARQAVKAMGGSIGLRSPGPGRGAVASIHLPLGED